VYCESVAGEGTTMRIVLPRAELEIGAVEDKTPSDDAPSPPPLPLAPPED
jgi:hypothetical protein